MIIYSIKNTVNGKMYIGQTTQKFNVRRNDHFRALRKNKHENPHLQFSWNKHGESSFKFSIIQECEDQDESDFIETYWIETLKPILYNIRSGGNGGCKFDEESRKRMSESLRKRFEKNPSFLSEIAKKQWQDPDMREFQINRLKDLWKDPIRRAKMVKNLECTPEEKSRRTKESWKDPEYRAKFEKSYGKILSPTGTIYEVTGLLKFSKKHKLDPGTLSNVFRGKAKQHKGWTKLND